MNSCNVENSQNKHKICVMQVSVQLDKRPICSANKVIFAKGAIDSLQKVSWMHMHRAVNFAYIPSM